MIHIYMTHEFAATHAYVTHVHMQPPTCDSFMYVCWTPHTPMFLHTYTYDDVQTYEWTTRHALHVDTNQNDLL